MLTSKSILTSTSFRAIHLPKNLRSFRKSHLARSTKNVSSQKVVSGPIYEPFWSENSVDTIKPRRRDMVQGASGLLLSSLVFGSYANAASSEEEEPVKFKRVRQTGFIAALGDPEASAGTGTEDWGLWRVDPGPRGVQLKNYKSLEATGGLVPARGGNWVFDKSDWWLEEHGLIMEPPAFPMPPGKYIVTGGRKVQTVLTIKPDRSWELANGAKLYDVTHLPCRAARYNPIVPGASPANANLKDFPVTPGAEMPAVEGTKKQDYAVLFVIGLEASMPDL